MDHAAEHRARLIRSVETPEVIRAGIRKAAEREANRPAAKLARVVRAMGSKLQCHPGYDRSRHAHHDLGFKVSAALALFRAAGPQVFWRL